MILVVQLHHPPVGRRIRLRADVLATAKASPLFQTIRTGCSPANACRSLAFLVDNGDGDQKI